MRITVLIFTTVGSFVSSLVPSNTMGGFSVFMTMVLGVKFIVKPVMTTKEMMEEFNVKQAPVSKYKKQFEAFMRDYLT